MIQQYVTDSHAALTAISAPGLKNVWIHGSITYIRTGSEYQPVTTE